MLLQSKLKQKILVMIYNVDALVESCEGFLKAIKAAGIHVDNRVYDVYSPMQFAAARGLVYPLDNARYSHTNLLHVLRFHVNNRNQTLVNHAASKVMSLLLLASNLTHGDDIKKCVMFRGKYQREYFPSHNKYSIAVCERLYKIEDNLILEQGEYGDGIDYLHMPNIYKCIEICTSVCADLSKGIKIITESITEGYNAVNHKNNVPFLIF